MQASTKLHSVFFQRIIVTVEYKAIVPPYYSTPTTTLSLSSFELMLQCSIWFGSQHFFVGCVVWRQEFLRNGCIYYNNSWNNFLNARKRKKSSTNSSIRTISKRLKKKILLFINVSFWKFILTCVSKCGCLFQKLRVFIL
ncbi:unnamed protein product [Sphagnum troendelagicum]|uniref:Uncharacterized protein n=1 Tax=Sphagnum troendelagicum TaxID=128251 RepID=A0ABP0T9E7_9BRYO